MSPHSVPCDSSTLERYLSGSRGAGEQQRLEQHLSDCDACRRALERLAADDRLWTQAAESLGPSSTHGDIELGTHTRIDAWQIWREAASDGASEEQLVSCDGLASYLRHWLEGASELTNPASPGESVTDDEILGSLADYDVLAVVERGGMGLVLRARDRRLGREVAIKTLPPQLNDNSVARERFVREAQVAAGLRHDNIIDIYSVSNWRGVPYLVMPFMHCGSLRAFSVGRGLFGLDEILGVAEQLAAGLMHAHAQSVVHRDIKPSNILLDGGLERIVIADFGLARAMDDERMTMSGGLAGTPQFMSPEQARGESVNQRSDLFSLGSLLYWMATGRSPFQSESCYGTIHKIIAQPHPTVQSQRSEFPECFDRLLNLLLVKEPDQRRTTAAQLRALIQGCRRHLRSPQAMPLPAELQGSLSKKLTAWSMAALACCVVIMGAAVWGVVWGASGDATPSAVRDEPQPTAQVAPSVEMVSQAAVVEPSYRRPRRGPLDELDLLNVLAELPKGIEAEYWLSRLNDLSVSEIPLELLPALEKLSQSPNADQARLAREVLNKNPFELLESDNPFVSSNPTPFFDQ